MPDQNRVLQFIRPKSTKTEQPPVFADVPVVVLVVIGMLVGIHGLLWLLGPDWQVWSLYAFSFIPARLLGPDAIAAPTGASIWTFFTYGFLHGDWTHVMFNGMWMLVFATPVARRLGAVRTLVCLSVAVLAGSAAMLPLHWGEFLIIVGASGAVSGAMAAAMPIMYSARFDRSLTNLNHLRVVPFGELIKDTRALGFTALFFGMQLITGAVQASSTTAFLNERSIAWEAHVGGFIAGLIAFYILDRYRTSTLRFM